MSQLIRWSLNRLYEIDPDIFASFELIPIPLQHHLLVDIILQEYGNMGIAFPVNTFSKNISLWQQTHKALFEQMNEILEAHFSPIENYDRYEEYSDIKTGKTNQTSSGTGHSEATGNTTLKEGAYPAGQLKLASSSDATSGSTSNSSSTGETNVSDSIKHTAHIHGNIGITTSTKMLNEFAEWSEFNVYKHIADIFARDLLVGIYFF